MDKITEIEVLGMPIEVNAGWRGRDLLLSVTGGDSAHIGSVSVCRMQGGKAVLDKILLPTHRDDVVSDKFAEALAHKLNTTVCVVSGIHFDCVSNEEIAEIVKATDKMLEQILKHFC